MSRTINGPQLVEAVRTLAANSRAIPLADYMRMKDKFERMLMEYPSFRGDIIKGMSKGLFYHVDDKAPRYEVFAQTKKLASDLLYGIERRGEVQIEKIYLIYSLGKKRGPDTSDAEQFGEDLAYWSMDRKALHDPFGLPWMKAIVPKLR